MGGMFALAHLCYGVSFPELSREDGMRMARRVGIEGQTIWDYLESGAANFDKPADRTRIQAIKFGFLPVCSGKMSIAFVINKSVVSASTRQYTPDTFKLEDLVEFQKENEEDWRDILTRFMGVIGESDFEIGWMILTILDD